MIRPFRFFLGICRYQLSHRPFPLFVNWAVTNRCNLQCRYCCGSYRERQEQDIATDRALALLDELAGLGTRMVNFNGGEPLLRQDIGSLIRAARKRGMVVGMNTNGTLVKERMAEIGALDSICISLDGDEEENDRTRGAGTYRRIREGLEAALAAGMRVHTNTVVTRNNPRCLDFILELARTHRIQSQFHFPFASGKGEKDGSISLGDETVRSVLTRLLQLKEQGAPVQFSLSSHRNALAWPFGYAKKLCWEGDPIPPAFRPVPCYAGKLMGFLDADGAVYPCSQLSGIVPAAKVQEVGFREAFARLSSHRCRACYFICHLDFNQIFDLDFRVIANSLRR